jgi:hypothetical protein
VTSQQAAGFIFAAAGKDLATMGPKDSFTLSDGFASKTFEFTTGMVGAPRIAILFDPASSDNALMAGNIISAINGSGLQITAELVMAGGSVVKLTNQRFSTIGNGTTSAPRLTEDVVTSNFAVIEMSGGQGGNCSVGTDCATNEDCISHTCDTATHLCQ